jgi:hypothetical protein
MLSLLLLLLLLMPTLVIVIAVCYCALLFFIFPTRCVRASISHQLSLVHKNSLFVVDQLDLV